MTCCNDHDDNGDHAWVQWLMICGNDSSDNGYGDSRR